MTDLHPNFLFYFFFWQYAKRSTFYYFLQSAVNLEYIEQQAKGGADYPYGELCKDGLPYSEKTYLVYNDEIIEGIDEHSGEYLRPHQVSFARPKIGESFWRGLFEDLVSRPPECGAQDIGDIIDEVCKGKSTLIWESLKETGILGHCSSGSPIVFALKRVSRNHSAFSLNIEIAPHCALSPEVISLHISKNLSRYMDICREYTDDFQKIEFNPYMEAMRTRFMDPALVPPLPVGWTHASFSARLVGLWLRDRVYRGMCMPSGKKVSQAEAIRELERRFDLERLGLGNSEASDLRFYYRRTIECVRTGGVLPFTKGKKGNPH